MLKSIITEVFAENLRKRRSINFPSRLAWHFSSHSKNSTRWHNQQQNISMRYFHYQVELVVRHERIMTCHCFSHRLQRLLLTSEISQSAPAKHRNSNLVFLNCVFIKQFQTEFTRNQRLLWRISSNGFRHHRFIITANSSHQNRYIHIHGVDSRHISIYALPINSFNFCVYI